MKEKIKVEDLDIDLLEKQSKVSFDKEQKRLKLREQAYTELTEGQISLEDYLKAIQ